MAHRPAPHSRSAVARAGHDGDHQVLLDGLASDDATVRATAITGLARAGQLSAAQLATGARDPGAAVRRRVAGLLGDAVGAAFDPGAGLLLRLLDDADAAVLDWACWAAGERAEDAAFLVGPLAALARRHPEALVREAAVAALGSLGHPDGADAVLAACDDVATVRRRAVLALVAFDGPQAEATLARLCDDRDWQVRQAAEELSDPADPADPTV